MKKRILACLLALVMVLSLLTVVVMAADDTTVPVPVTALKFDGGKVQGIEETWLSAHSGKKLAVTIPDNIGGVAVTGIGKNAFAGLRCVESVRTKSSSENSIFELPESLTEIGARATCVGTDADAQTLCRALGKGRTSAVLLLEEPKKGSLPERTAALLTVMTETREAGVPLFMLLSDVQSSPIQTAALGVSRGLLGDPVRTIILRRGADCRMQDIVYGALLLGVRAFEKPELNGTFNLYDAQMPREEGNK